MIKYTFIILIFAMLSCKGNSIDEDNPSIKEVAEDIGDYIPIPQSDSSILHLIKGDSSADFIRYADGHYKITIRKTN